ncbi:MAG: hypothetical protein U7126_18395 [Microcoleus sp.]
MATPNFNLQGLLSGSRWPQGTSQLTYSFINDDTDDLYVADFGNGKDIRPLPSSVQPSSVQTYITNILNDVYGSVIPINFKPETETLRPKYDNNGNFLRYETGNTGQLRFMYSNLTTTNDKGEVQEKHGEGLWPTADALNLNNRPDRSTELTGDVYFDPKYENGFSLFSGFSGGWLAGPGGDGYETMIHEIGHTLGLKHPFSAGAYEDQPQPLLPGLHDNNTNTVMSYNRPGSNAVSLMPYDIFALQSLYKAKQNNHGDTTYKFYNVYSYSDGIKDYYKNTFKGEPVKSTIWDSGGENDTLDFSDVKNLDLGGIIGGTTKIIKSIASSVTGLISKEISILLKLDYVFDMNPGGMLSELSAYSNYKKVMEYGTELAYSPGLPSFDATIENLIGSPINDLILGNNKANTIYGNKGQDMILGGGNNDKIYGGDGNDKLYGGGTKGESQSGDQIIQDGANTPGSNQNSFLGFNGSTNNDEIDVTSYEENPDNSIIVEFNTTEFDGNDTLSGGNGDDAIEGGNGNDYLYGDGNNDILLGGTGADNLYGGDNEDQLYGGEDNDFLSGGGGVDNLYGEVGNDALQGDGGNDNLYGGKGNDILNGNEGQDILYGELGNDQASGDEGNDILFGQEGNDTLSGGTDQDQLYGGDNEDILNGNDGQDTLYGETGNDSLNGDAGNDSLLGQLGNDTLNGGTDNDNLYGGKGEDSLNGDAGNDFLYGNLDNDILNGGDNADILYGEEGDDQLAGNTGNDTLSGGDGQDLLNGNEDDDLTQRQQRPRHPLR